MRRLVAVGLAIGSALVFSGCLLTADQIGCAFYGDEEACDRLLELGLGGFLDERQESPDRPRGPQDYTPPRPSELSQIELVSAQRGRPFRASFTAAAVRPVKPKRGRRGRLAFRRIRATGSFTGIGTPPPDLAAFTRGSWQGLLNASLDRRRRRLSVTGVVVATFSSGQACLRFSGRANRRRGRARRATLRGRFRTLGGPAGIRASGRWSRSDTGLPGFALRGRGSAEPTAPSALPRACTRMLRIYAGP